MPDADGDGVSDLLVGASSENGGASGAGRAYLFSGATGGLLHTLESPESQLYGSFGESVSGVADADGDGRGDLLVGAVNEDVAGFSAVGRAYLFSGATGALLHTLDSPNLTYEGSFGWSASGVPDVDGDGRSDLLIGADEEISGEDLRTGRAYLFSGATGTLIYGLPTPALPQSARFGYSVSGAPDADGDGRDDLLVGAPGANGGGVRRAGRAYLFSGATGALLHTLISPNPEGSGFFGFSVSGVSDADSDGRGDLLVGASRESSSVENAGRAHLFSGATGALLRTLESPNAEISGSFGNSVSGVPDASGDGRGDFLVGAHREEVNGVPYAGRAYLFLSDTGVLLTASGTPTTIAPGGTVTVAATVSNTTNQPAPLDLWVVTERNGNPVLTRLIGSGTLPAGATVTRSFSLTAPGTTPPGTYTVNVNVGTFPSTVLASDAFGVTVTGERRAGAPSAEPLVVTALPGDLFGGDEPASAASSTSSVAVSPNPFSRRAVLRFALTEAGVVRLSVHDVLGREVAVLVEGVQEAGAHTAPFDAAGLASGVYVWRLAAGGTVQTGRLTLLE